MIRKRFVFRGYVQGVGFRWRARHAAGLYGCTGFVRNEYDGSVVMELQGSAEAIGMVLEIIRESPYIGITETEEQAMAPDEDESVFRAE